MNSAFVGLGSNVGDREAHLLAALRALAGLALPESRVAARSHVYETRAVGPSSRPFLNAAIEVETTASARVLLAALQQIERSRGRVRGERWAARTLDLDLLLYRDQKLGWAHIDEPGLTVPHPAIASRDFVLVPLADLGLTDPVVRDATVAELLGELDPEARTIISRRAVLGSSPPTGG